MRLFRFFKRQSTRALVLELHAKANRIMADIDDIKTDLDTIKSNVGGIATRLTAQSDQIAQLQEQLAAAGVDPELLAKVAALKAEADGIAADTAALVPPPAAPPTESQPDATGDSTLPSGQ